MNAIDTIAIAGLPVAEPAEVGLSSAALAHLTAVMSRQIQAGRVPGMSMLISRHGKVAYHANLGALGPEGPPMRADAIFRIYSMTKPIVSIALMMLVEDGQLFLNDPLAKFIPEFADCKVGVAKGETLELVDAHTAITLQDLMRHTSGLTYAFTGSSLVQRLYAKAPLRRQDITSAEFCSALAHLPLMWQPGEQFEYSHSTDVIGRVIEIVSGQTLDTFLQERLFAPLGMVDTGFYAPLSKHHRIADGFAKDPVTGATVKLIEARVAPKFESGGGGLVSTMADYARFVRMLQVGGTLEGARIVSPRTIKYMTSNHLDAQVRVDRTLLTAGNLFGLGFGVRTQMGVSPTAGSVGEYAWGGLAGTAFWVSPQDDFYAIMMIQALEQRDYFRQLFRTLVYSAIEPS